MCHFAEMWMDLKSVIRSEISQEEKKIYIIYKCIYVESRKNGTYECICKTEIETQMNIFAKQE